VARLLADGIQVQLLFILRVDGDYFPEFLLLLLLGGRLLLSYATPLERLGQSKLPFLDTEPTKRERMENDAACD
jgi:hypothetical protein